MELIASILPKTVRQEEGSAEEDLDGDTEEVLREALILLLRLIYAEAQAQLVSTKQELELLRNAPPEPPTSAPTNDPRVERRRAEDGMWKLDAPLNRGGPDGKGPLLDPQGKVSIIRVVLR